MFMEEREVGANKYIGVVAHVQEVPVLYLAFSLWSKSFAEDVVEKRQRIMV